MLGPSAVSQGPLGAASTLITSVERGNTITALSRRVSQRGSAPLGDSETGYDMSYCPRVQRWDHDDPNRPPVASFVWGHLLTPTGSLMANRRNAAQLAKIDPLLRFPQDAHPPDAV